MFGKVAAVFGLPPCTLDVWLLALPELTAGDLGWCLGRGVFMAHCGTCLRQ